MRTFTVIFLVISLLGLQKGIAKGDDDNGGESSSSSMPSSSESSSSSESASTNSESDDDTDEVSSVPDKIRDLIHRGAERFKTRINKFREVRNGIENIFLGEN